MTLADVIRRALGKLGQDVNEGVTPADLALGLTVANAILSDLVEGEKFGPLNNVLAGGDIEAGEGQRIYAEAGVTVTLPTTIMDDGRRAPRALAPLLIVQDGVEKAYFFSPRTGGWVRIDNLASSDTFPLSDTEGFAAMLAEAMAPDFGGMAALSPDVPRHAASARTKLSLRLGAGGGETELTYY